ncbi:DUF2922 domain-containing protein [Alkalibacter saccharofermentans]|jgi:hypothetical protein|uniref:DUF2922 domain-containing protein n=1 Tax=Alkalibacter saccharofermentans DSM 14828 TaxID=1120975 RepID=A0A1M4WPL1_9FIRM|nr:DUF2922 domain-containing protein [Alkalibacter saccharofermentans]SHE82912.1 Protein of unknown function [Alkalibacter saccharofermentans DSM 14828]
MATLKLDMSFKRADGYNSKITVDNARADVTAAEAGAMMDMLITTGIFQPSGSPLAEKVSAQLITTEVTELEV